MKKKINIIFCCQACGYQTSKWLGKCPDCGKWDTLIEETRSFPSIYSGNKNLPNPNLNHNLNHNLHAQPVPIDSIAIEDQHRLSTGLVEFDRVLGGGLVSGSLVLIGGDPGIGKSTLMLQALHGIAKNGRKVLYVSGEESIMQIRIRSKRLSSLSSNLLVVSEIDIGAILAMLDSVKPDVLVIDSIQTMFSPDITSAPGSVSQVRESTMQIMLTAKKTDVPVFLIGHVTKDGAIAGPRLLEHMVDTVLYFEGDRNHVFRILRAVKNRFGSTNEIGVFEMNEKGLVEVLNPSSVFLAECPEKTPGSIVTASMEGSRPILVEIQALAGNTSFGTPRRTILGIDKNRVALLLAVIEKKLNMHMMGQDIFMNVAGGVKIDEPAIDLGIVSAVVSSFLDKPILERTVVVGEVGLTGEIRAISNIDVRISEAEKMGFSRCLVPQSNLKRISVNNGLELIGIKTIPEAVEVLF